MYADDDQLYIFFDVMDKVGTADAILRVESCVSDISVWMTANKLKFNEDKTEVIVISSRQHQANIDISSVKAGEFPVTPKSCVRNLGVLFDRTLSMEDHAKSVSKAAFFQLRNIGSIKPILQKQTLEKLIHSFITVRIDYCNSLLYATSNLVIQKIQRVQNSAARLLTGTRKYEHITPVLQSLHWLPVPYRIEYKILLLTFKALNGMAPKYLRELITLYEPSRALRSTDSGLLTVKKTRLKTYGDRAFCASAPKLWNLLPACIRKATSLDSFKTQLKTHLFVEAFGHM